MILAAYCVYTIRLTEHPNARVQMEHMRVLGATLLIHTHYSS